MTYVLIRSWHRIVGWSRAGYAITRCGRTVAIKGSIGSLSEIHVTAEHLRLDDPSCETCLRLTAHDQERGVDDDAVPA
jgi:hypothetical protein